MYNPLSGRPAVWVVLQDSHANYYLQNAPVKFLLNGRWRANNILPGHGICRINFVLVNRG
jgi:hypothetical protein